MMWPPFRFLITILKEAIPFKVHPNLIGRETLKLQDSISKVGNPIGGNNLYLKDITVKVKTLPSGKIEFAAAQNGNLLCFGVVETYTFNLMTKVFKAGTERITGVKEVLTDE